MSEDPEYVNSAIFDILGAIPSIPGFPNDDKAIELFYMLTNSGFTPENVISSVSSNLDFQAHLPVIRDATSGMTPHSIAVVVNDKFVDRNFPGLMKIINTSDALFEFYKAVLYGVIGLVVIDEVPESEAVIDGQSN